METPTFAELPLSPKVQAAVATAGYTIPTPIQAQAIPVAVSGRDVLGIAQTGTGKTASFVLPMITRLESGRARARMPRSLILAPTRELAAQVAQSFEKYGVNHKLDLALLIGGVSMDDQVKKLDRGVDVLIATPGRLLDHFGRGRIMLMGVEILVIDEADRMLDMGFIPDIEKICKLLPPKRQTLFFSATMPPEITRLVSQFLTDPVRIEVAKPATTAKTITQLFRYCPDGEDYAKREVLRELIRAEKEVKNAIIFCNRKRDVAILYKSMQKHGFNVGALHGDMEQSARMATLDAFRSGKITFLAASDVAARGLDIPEVSHVFNFDVPWAGDDYVHRIGRTGRAGREGRSLSLVGPDDLRLVKDIEKVTGEAPVWIGEPPTEEDFAQAGKRKRGRGRLAAGRRGAPERRGAAEPARSREHGGRVGDGHRMEGRDRGPRAEAPPRRERPRRDDHGTSRPPREWREPRVGLLDDAPAAPRSHDRMERTERPQRVEREDRVERVDRMERPDRGERREQPERAARSHDDRPRRVRNVDAPGFGEQPTIPGSKTAAAERDRGPVQSRGQRPERSGAMQPAKGRQEQGNDRGRRSEPSVGFQENVPAFLRRPVKLASS